MNSSDNLISVTGIGISSSIGNTPEVFLDSLLAGKSNFKILERPGREGKSQFIGAELDENDICRNLSKKMIRNASLSASIGLATAIQACEDSRYKEIDGTRIGLIVAGSNFQQRELSFVYSKYSGNEEFITPSFGYTFWDSDICGLCSEALGIQGFAYTTGGASASGQLAIIQGMNAINQGLVDLCVVIGPVTDLSYLELQAFTSMGALGSAKFFEEPQKASRPFDTNRDGFIFGESCGVLVLEKEEHAKKRGASIYGHLVSFGIHMDGNRLPNPNIEGEYQAIRKALTQAGISEKDIQYINPHGTGSIRGDEIELAALKCAGFEHAYINATKSLIGHGLCSSGIVEVIAALLQIKHGKLHPTRNLDSPISDSFNWVLKKQIEADIRYALCMNIGFGGMNTALCIKGESA